MPQVSRYQKWTPPKQCTLATTLSDTPEIPMAEYTGLVVGIPVNSPIGLLSFYGSLRQSNEPDPNVPAQAQGGSQANYYQITDPVSGNPITLSVTGGAGGGGNNPIAGQAYDVSLVISPTGRINFGSLKIVADKGGPIELSAKA